MAGLDGGTSHATCSLAACRRCRHCDLAASTLPDKRQSRRLPAAVAALEKQRVVGGGPKFTSSARRVMYAVSDLDAWADQRSYEATSDPEYAERHAGDYRDGR